MRSRELEIELRSSPLPFYLVALTVNIVCARNENNDNGFSAFAHLWTFLNEFIRL